MRSDLSRKGLAWAHIFGEDISIDDGGEALDPVTHGNGAGGFVAAVTGPAAEAGDGPACPTGSIGRVGIFLLGRSPLQLCWHRMQGFNLDGVEHTVGWTGLAAASACQR